MTENRTDHQAGKPKPQEGTEPEAKQRGGKFSEFRHRVRNVTSRAALRAMTAGTVGLAALTGGSILGAEPASAATQAKADSGYSQVVDNLHPHAENTKGRGYDTVVKALNLHEGMRYVVGSEQVQKGYDNALISISK